MSQEQPTYPQPPQMIPPPPAPKKRSRGKFFAIGCGSLILLLVIIGIIAAAASSGGGNNSATTIQVTDTPTDTPTQDAQANATANAIANGTPAAGACGSKCGTASTPQAPAAPAHTYSGNGSKTTETFSVSDTWTITWTCDATNNYGVDGELSIIVYDSQGNLIDNLLETCKAGVTSKGSSEEHQGGDVYLKIDGSVPWTLKITELQ